MLFPRKSIDCKICSIQPCEEYIFPLLPFHFIHGCKLGFLIRSQGGARQQCDSSKAKTLGIFVNNEALSLQLPFWKIFTTNPNLQKILQTHIDILFSKPFESTLAN